MVNFASQGMFQRKGETWISKSMSRSKTLNGRDFKSGIWYFFALLPKEIKLELDTKFRFIGKLQFHKQVTQLLLCPSPCRLPAC